VCEKRNAQIPVCGIFQKIKYAKSVSWRSGPSAPRYLLAARAQLGAAWQKIICTAMVTGMDEGVAEWTRLHRLKWNFREFSRLKSKWQKKACVRFWCKKINVAKKVDISRLKSTFAENKLTSAG